MERKEKNFMRDIMQYCAKAEHCTMDVIKKLQAWNVEEDEIELVLEKLRKEKFLDDDRYTKAYVNDKWKIEHWGKKKIRHQLFLKNIEDRLVEKALDAIDDEEYKSELASQLSRKEKESLGIDTEQMKKRLYNFGVSRGFEEEFIFKWLEGRGHV